MPDARAEADRQVLAPGRLAPCRRRRGRRRGRVPLRAAVTGGGIVQRPGYGQAGPDFLDQRGGQLREEARWRAVFRPAVDPAALGVAQVEPLHRPGDADVAEPALLGQLLGVEHRALRREQALLQAHHEHGGKLESLGAVQRHQLHAVAALGGLGLAGLERRVRQERRQQRQVVLELGREALRRVDQLVEVLDAGLAARVLFLRVVLPQPGVLDHAPDLLVQLEAGDPCGEALDQADEAGEGRRRPRRQDRQQRLRRVPQRRAGAARGLPQPLERGLADAARRQVDDALEGHVVGAVLRQAQVGQRVLDLGALEEAQAAVHAVGDARGHQRLLEGARLGVGTVEDRRGRQRQAAAGVLADPLDHEVGLVALVEGSVQPDRLAARGLGPQLLAEPVLVPADDLVGGAEDDAGRAVVLLQLEDRRAEVAAEVLHVLDAGAAPAIDGLVVVADDERRARLAADQLDPVVLHAVGVLELVHQHVPEAMAVEVGQLRLVADHLEAAQQQLGEVHHAELVAAALVEVVQPDQLAARRVAAVLQVLRPPALVLLAVDEALHLARDPALLVQVLLPEQLAHQPVLVVVVEDLEVLRQPGLAPVPAQQAVRDAVEGADPQRAGRHVQQRLDPAAHLAGRLVGEGDGEQALRGDALLLDEPGGTVREHARLAAAGAGEDQRRGQRRADGRALRLVQRREEGVGGGHEGRDSFIPTRTSPASAPAR